MNIESITMEQRTANGHLTLGELMYLIQSSYSVTVVNSDLDRRLHKVKFSTGEIGPKDEHGITFAGFKFLSTNDIGFICGNNVDFPHINVIDFYNLIDTWLRKKSYNYFAFDTASGKKIGITYELNDNVFLWNGEEIVTGLWVDDDMKMFTILTKKWSES